MKKIFKFLVILPLLVVSPYFKANELKAAVTSAPASGEEIKTGTVLQVSIGFLFLDIAVLVDNETGAIYISEATAIDIHSGDTVAYSAPTASGRVIIRSVIRK